MNLKEKRLALFLNGFDSFLYILLFLFQISLIAFFGAVLFTVTSKNAQSIIVLFINGCALSSVACLEGALNMQKKREALKKVKVSVK